MMQWGMHKIPLVYEVPSIVPAGTYLFSMHFLTTRKLIDGVSMTVVTPGADPVVYDLAITWTRGSFEWVKPVAITIQPGSFIKFTRPEQLKEKHGYVTMNKFRLVKTDDDSTNIQVS